VTSFVNKPLRWFLNNWIVPGLPLVLRQHLPPSLHPGEHREDLHRQVGPAPLLRRRLLLLPLAQHQPLLLHLHHRRPGHGKVS
jgi:hypothetical protein